MSGFFGKLFGFGDEEEEGEECNNEEEEEIPDETFLSTCPSFPPSSSCMGYKLEEIDLNNPIPYNFFQTLRLR